MSKKPRLGRVRFMNHSGISTTEPQAPHSEFHCPCCSMRQVVASQKDEIPENGAHRRLKAYRLEACIHMDSTTGTLSGYNEVMSTMSSMFADRRATHSDV